MSVLNEVTKCIIIPENTSSPSSKKFINKNYSLKTNLFDPAKSSPPNDFMMKLYMRFDTMTPKTL